MRRYLTAILSPYCTVIEAPDGKAAFDIAVEHPPNLIVSGKSSTSGRARSPPAHDLLISLSLKDVMMPIMDGHQLLAALRSYDSEVSLVPLMYVPLISLILFESDWLISTPLSKTA